MNEPGTVPIARSRPVERAEAIETALRMLQSYGAVVVLVARPPDDENETGLVVSCDLSWPDSLTAEDMEHVRAAMVETLIESEQGSTETVEQHNG